MQKSGSTGGPIGEQEAFDRLLAMLDDDRNRAGEAYEALRRRMLTYFRMHGFAEAHDLFDRTMERAARRLSEAHVANATAYIVGIARFVCFEEERKRRRQVALGDIPEPSEPINIDDKNSKQLERALNCLKRCVARLGENDQNLVLRYYSYAKGEKVASRESMASALRTSGGALRVRLHRIRQRLETCVAKCLEKEEHDETN